jgi:hypothetical protein
MTHELSLPERAAVALGTATHEKELIALAKQSTDIITVSNAAGRDQAHRVGMTLRTARVNITKAGKEARDDATAFSKAVIAEEKRLIGIVEPEEARIIGLRDAFDAEEQARKDALIAAERVRVDGIQSEINNIRNIALDAVGKPSAGIKAMIKILGDFVVTEDKFAEFVKDASDAVFVTLKELNGLYVATFASEAEILRQQQEREATEAQAKKDREELAQQQAQLKRDREAAAAELQKQRDQIEAERVEAARVAKVEADRVARIRQMEDDKRAFDLKQAQDLLAKENEDLRQQRAALEAEQALLIAASAPKQEEVFEVPYFEEQPDGTINEVDPADIGIAAIERPSPDEIVKIPRNEIIQVLMEHFDESAEVVIHWIRNIDIDFSED